MLLKLRSHERSHEAGEGHTQQCLDRQQVLRQPISNRERFERTMRTIPLLTSQPRDILEKKRGGHRADCPTFFCVKLTLVVMNKNR